MYRYNYIISRFLLSNYFTKIYSLERDLKQLLDLV